MEGKKHYENAWLIDSNKLKECNFNDNYYLESLCYHISSFLKNTPIPIVCEYNNEKQSMDFSIGKIKKSFKVSVDYSYFDFITLVKKWTRDFYPKYDITYDIDVPLSIDEMKDLIGQGKDANDVVHLYKKQEIKEKAVIEKITLKDDQFILNKNGKRFVYLSGTLKNPMSISEFKRNVYKIKDDLEKKNFIDENSRLIKEIVNDKELIIDYQGKQMVNFFKVNIDYLVEHEFREISPFIYKFGRFLVRFSSQTLMDDCMRYYKHSIE